MAVYIVPRETKKGKVWHVRFKASRYAPIVHLGRFDKKSHAQQRRDWALSELAQGRIPDRGTIVAPMHVEKKRLGRIADAYLATRIDVAESSLKAYTSRLSHAVDYFGEEADVSRITTEQVQQFIIEEEDAPRSVRLRVEQLRLALDFAGVDPNPCRGKLRFPMHIEVPRELPSRAVLAAVYSKLDDDDAPYAADALMLMEHGGLRPNEALKLVGADVDYDRERLLANSKTRAGKRWVSYAYDWCEWEPSTVPANDRLFPITYGQMNYALRKAIKDTGVKPAFSPHTLRHLHASRCLHYHWLSAAELAVRLGHANSRITLETYNHVIPPD